MILKISKRVDACCPEHPLDEAEPSKYFFHSFLADKLNHLVEHAVTVLKAVGFSIKQIVVRVIDFADTFFNKKLAIGLDDLQYFFRCHGASF